MSISSESKPRTLSLTHPPATRRTIGVLEALSKALSATFDKNENKCASLSVRLMDGGNTVDDRADIGPQFDA